MMVQAAAKINTSCSELWQLQQACTGSCAAQQHSEADRVADERHTPDWMLPCSELPLH